MALPRNGLSGADIKDDKTDWKNIIVESDQ
jgi:hypothetical protein